MYLQWSLVNDVIGVYQKRDILNGNIFFIFTNNEIIKISIIRIRTYHTDIYSANVKMGKC